MPETIAWRPTRTNWWTWAMPPMSTRSPTVDMPGEVDVVGQNDVIAELAVVADVGVDHQHAAGADARRAVQSWSRDAP